MKAIVQDVYGSADVLKLAEIEKPEPAEGEVLVRVHAAGVDRGVWHLMTGEPYLMRILGFGLHGPKARVPGMDLAGVVEAVGANVKRLRAGDEVFGEGQGSFAEYARASEEQLAAKPANLAFDEAAAIPVSACTALQGLRDVGKLEAGQKVLVVGASGGVGTFAVQIANAFGAEVTGVCSTAKTDLVRSIGAHEVIDYTREDFTDGTRQWDLILDVGGNRSLSRLRGALTPGGTLVVAGGEEGGRWLGGVDRTLRATFLSPFTGHRLRGLLAKTRREDLDVLRTLIEEGKVKPVIERRFPLEEAAEAIQYLEDGRVRGKLVVTV